MGNCSSTILFKGLLQDLFPNIDNSLIANNEDTEIIKCNECYFDSNIAFTTEYEKTEIIEEQETKKKNTRKPRFDKRKIKQELSDENMASTVITEGVAIEPVLPELPKETEKAEDTKEEISNEEAKPIKATRSRRPNRNSQRKARTTKNTKKDEE